VFEQDTSLYQRPRDWNFTIFWSQNGLKSCLPEHLLPLVKGVQTDPKYDTDENNSMPIYNGQTGDLLKGNPVPFGWRVQRRNWLALLQDGLDIKVKSNAPCFLVDYHILKTLLIEYSGVKHFSTLKRQTIS
jgi:hypothetical protein